MRLWRIFPDVQMVSAPEAPAAKFTPNRVNQRWDILAKLSRLFLSSVYQTAHGGNREGIALLFDMNDLFESYIAAMARKACLPLGYQVCTQGPHGHLTWDKVFQTRPDVHVTRGNNVFVLDTKWKKVDPEKPNFGVDQNDAYQMHAYAHVYKSCATILLYPHHSGIPAPPGEKTRWKFKSDGSDLILATIDVAKPPSELVTALRRLLESPEERMPLQQNLWVDFGSGSRKDKSYRCDHDTQRQLPEFHGQARYAISSIRSAHAIAL